MPDLRKLVAKVKPLAPERYKVQFTVSRQTQEQLREAQNCRPHSTHVGAIFERALTVLLTASPAARHALVDRPRLTSRSSGAGRHVPAVVKRAVWERDSGQCAFTGAAGRCTERGFLEITTSFPLRTAAQRVPITWSSAAGRTIHMRPHGGSEHR